ncbi:MAG: ISL3 family transposase [Lachnospiraceae bacterium]|nr:ISL3 family transposase [Lachnospiraceae bacterium]
MNYIHTEANGQMVFAQERCTFLMIPSSLDGFNNSDTTEEVSRSGRTVYCFNGTLDDDMDRICSHCGSKMHVNNHPDVELRHLCFGGALTVVRFSKLQLRCPKCGATLLQEVPFKAEHHRMTQDLYNYTRDLLALGNYTNRQVGQITGLDENVVKTIDKRRLQEKYTLDGKKLIKPEKPARILGIDEFKLHDGHLYATHIIDMDNGHILWISHGKKKQVVYDFIDHVGLDWMDGVEAVACDMNSDFQEAFEEKCPHIQPVFDHFHIVKNFNEKVISAVRKDEQKRLLEEGDEEAAKSLKRTKYILTSSRKTLQRKDQEAREGRVISKGSALFCKEEVRRKEGYMEKYEELLQQNQLLFAADLVKEKLADAYRMVDEPVMAKAMIEIIDLCRSTENAHFIWFANLIENHFEGIIAHATYQITSGKVEGINNKIKTLRRQGYGYPDDEYFFLKLFDISRKDYVRNLPSHKILE